LPALLSNRLKCLKPDICNVTEACHYDCGLLKYDITPTGKVKNVLEESAISTFRVAKEEYCSEFIANNKAT
jgi:hypothetical protein